MNNYSQTPDWIEPLGHREVKILRLISEGLSNYEIAQKLMLSTETVRWYNKQIFSKLGVKNRTQAARKAVEYKILASPIDETEGDRRQSGNLPSQITSFVGRKREMAEIKQLLKTSRLVVLTGPGGCGKSRLAIQVAAGLIEYYRDGAWLVEFASISEPALVANAIVRALQINASSDTSLTDVLKHSLARKHLLLLLDNFEHLLEAGPLVTELLAASPQVTILATSRERLHLYGEQEYPVHPLRLPDLKRGENNQQLLAYEAIDLFVQRAQSARFGFTVDEDLVLPIAHICVRLDGLPLAIELAASQVKTHSPVDLSQLLEEGLDALPSGPRDQPARQRTLRATLEWSYHLLTEQEKILFARLAVFKGGTTLDAISRVCSQGLSRNVFKILGTLVEKNLVKSRQNSDGEMRFTMLETIRQYAAERLESSGKAENIRVLQASYLADLVEAAQKEIYSARQEYWFGRLRDELDNLRSVLTWSLNGNEYEYGLRLAAALQEFWLSDGLAAEGRRWTDLALDKSIQAKPGLRAGVLRSAGHIALSFNETHRSKELLSQAIQLFEQNLDERNTAWSLVLLSGSYDKDAQEIQQGINLSKKALALFRNQGNKPGLLYSLNMLGELARAQKDYDAAQRYYEESLSIAVETGARQREATVLNNLSFVAYHQQNYRLAVELAYRALILARELKSDFRQACFIATVAGPATAFGRPVVAAQLLGASYARFESLGILHAPVDQSELDLFEAATRKQLGDEIYWETWKAGQTLTLEEAVTLALSELVAGNK